MKLITCLKPSLQYIVEKFWNPIWLWLESNWKVMTKSMGICFRPVTNCTSNTCGMSLANCFAYSRRVKILAWCILGTLSVSWISGSICSSWSSTLNRVNYATNSKVSAKGKKIKTFTRFIRRYYLKTMKKFVKTLKINKLFIWWQKLKLRKFFWENTI